MNKLNVFIFATCQGGAIAKFLNESQEFRDKYNITDVVRNYQMIHNDEILIDKYYTSLRDTDVFIYQPLDDRYGKNSTNYLKSLLKSTCITISIPYVYNFSLWPLVPALNGDVTDEWCNRDGYNSVTKNIEIIDDLIKSGLSLNEILLKYDNNQIDFNYDERHDKTMKILKEKDKYTDIKVHDYIKENISKKRLFLYASHPTSYVFIHMTNQILNILGLENIGDEYPIDFVDLKSPIPIAFSTCSNNFFKFEFISKDEKFIANEFYRNIIIKYFNSRK